jgi:hypothetical protein
MLRPALTQPKSTAQQPGELLVWNKDFFEGLKRYKKK